MKIMGLNLRLGEVLLVTMISILIFYLAFSQTKKEVELNVEVQFHVPEERATELTILRPTGSTGVRLVVEGSAVARKDAESLERSLIQLVVGDTGVPSEIGENSVDVQSALQRVLQARQIDAAVKSVAPAQLALRLDAPSSRAISVTATLPNARIDGNVVVEPATVTVSGPASMLEQAGEVRVEAIIDATMLQSLETGRRHAPTVPVRLVSDRPGADLSRIRVEPELVSVVFTLAARDRTLRIPSEGGQLLAVPVHVAISPVDLERFVITVPERDLLLSEIELHGPADQIAQIERGAFRAFAHIQLMTDDLERALVGDVESATIVRNVSLWALPPGVRVVNPGSTDAQIRARAAGEPPPAGVRITVRRRVDAE